MAAMLFAVLALSFVSSAFGRDKPTVIGVIGDWGRGQDGDYSLVGGFVQDDANSMIAVGKALAKTCWDQRCDFVINTGDNFYDLGIDATLGPADPQWDTSFNNVFNSKILNRSKFYGVLGNHDYGTNGSKPHTIQPQLEYTWTDPLQRWYLPSRYYNVDITNFAQKVRITATDTNPFIGSYCTNGNSKYNTAELRQFCAPAIRQGQLNHFNRSLAEGRAKGYWNIAVGHHPLFGKGGKNQPAHDSMIPIIAANRPQVWLNGHDHILYHLNYTALAPKTNFFCVGASSIYDPTDQPSSSIQSNFPFAGIYPGFGILKLYRSYGVMELWGVLNYATDTRASKIYSYSFKK